MSTGTREQDRPVDDLHPGPERGPEDLLLDVERQRVERRLEVLVPEQRDLDGAGGAHVSAPSGGVHAVGEGEEALPGDLGVVARARPGRVPARAGRAGSAPRARPASGGRRPTRRPPSEVTCSRSSRGRATPSSRQSRKRKRRQGSLRIFPGGPRPPPRTRPRDGPRRGSSGRADGRPSSRAPRRRRA